MYGDMRGIIDCFGSKGKEGRSFGKRGAEMTLDDLKIEADKLGYKLVKKSTREPLIPCTCGANSRALWFEGSKKLFYKCHGCGRKVYGKNKTDLRRQWNAAIKEVEDE